MAEENNAFHIGIPIYKGVDLMDVAAPYEIFNWMGYYWSKEPVAPRSVKVELIAATYDTLKTRDGMILTPDTTFDAVKQYLDLLWVPGGDPDALTATMKDPCYIGFLQRQAAGAGYVTSVCEGALLLASAGLLDGYEATTHWAFIPCLKSFCEIKVADGYPRFVVDRNRVTGGGISSGIDEALELVARVSSYAIAKQVQVVTQYFPRPPFTGDIPGSDTCPINM
jgi:Transcriptional regulator containing an amidase domain and an AraC-type DNA-binding HTH domain